MEEEKVKMTPEQRLESYQKQVEPQEAKISILLIAEQAAADENSRLSRKVADFSRKVQEAENSEKSNLRSFSLKMATNPSGVQAYLRNFQAYRQAYAQNTLIVRKLQKREKASATCYIRVQQKRMKAEKNLKSLQNKISLLRESITFEKRANQMRSKPKKRSRRK